VYRSLYPDLGFRDLIREGRGRSLASAFAEQAVSQRLILPQ
jgi:hypothetical protein